MLARAREDAGLEQEDVAQRIGVHAVTLSRYENDKRPVPPDVLAKLAAIYGLPGNAFDQPTVVPPPESGEVPMVALPLHVLTYWRGRVEEQVNTLQGVGQQIQTLGDSLRAMKDMLERATDGVSGLLDSGVLPQPPGPGGAPLITTDEVRRRVAERQAQLEREARESA
jgi:transcriptional regulator with XRE-family HTH domain